MGSKTLSINDVASMCEVSNETIRRWVKKNGMKAYNTGTGMSMKIMPADLKQFAEENNVFVDWDYQKETPEETTEEQG